MVSVCNFLAPEILKMGSCNDPFLTFVLHGDLYFKRIYVHPLPVFYFPNQDLGGGGGGGE